MSEKCEICISKLWLFPKRAQLACPSITAFQGNISNAICGPPSAQEARESRTKKSMPPQSIAVTGPFVNLGNLHFQ